ncbi:unnamed protein product [Closterium sp. Naga37s-1]|nr:unnamed protein product [Closterium sp. Naga37s-1]
MSMGWISADGVSRSGARRNQSLKEERDTGEGKKGRGNPEWRLRSGGRDGRGERVSKVGAWACIPAAADTEGKEEKVGAGVHVPAAADTEGKEKVGAGVHVPAAADTKGKEKVGAGVYVPAAAEAEGKNEKVGVQVCTPAIAVAEGKEEKMGVMSCKPEVAEAVGKNKELGARAGAPAAAEAAGKNGEMRVRAGVSAEMTSNWWQGELGIARWEGPVWDTAQEREEAEMESKEVGARECLPAGEGVEQTVGDEMRQEGNEALQTVRWIKGEN